MRQSGEEGLVDQRRKWWIFHLDELVDSDTYI